MRFGFLIAGIIFFFNPNYNLIDVAPDLIGCALILFGLGKLMDFAPHLEEAHKYFRWLLYTQMGKTVMIFVLKSLNDNTTITLLTFVFSCLEVFIMTAAFLRLIDGVQYLGLRYGGVAVALPPALKKMTVAFSVSKAILTFFPEISYLSSYEHAGYVTAGVGFDIGRYHGLFSGINIFCVLVLGIIWLTVILKYFNAVRKDGNFCNALSEKYEKDIRTDVHMFLQRRIGVALTFFICGLVFIVDIKLDGIDIIPDFVGCLLWTIAFAILIKDVAFAKIATIASAIYTVISFAAWMYIKENTLADYVFGIVKSVKAYNTYLTTVAISAAETLVFIAVVVIAFIIFSRIITEHTGEFGGEGFVMTEARNKELKKSLKIKNTVFLILSILLAAVTVYSSVITFYSKSNTGIMVVIDPVVSVIWLFVSFAIVGNLKDKVKERYISKI